MTSPIRPSLRDWPEDAVHENGCYLCRCVVCHETFTGHKRRAVCHVCADRDEAEAKRRAEWLSEHGAPSDWVVLTLQEVREMHGEYYNALTGLRDEIEMRHALIEAFMRVHAIVSKANLPGAHYALKDGMEIVREAHELDAPRENTPLPSPAGTGTVQA